MQTDQASTAGLGRALSVAVLLGALAMLLPLVVASHYGAFGIPRGDDWSYYLTLFRFVDTGTLRFNHWVSMALVGQLAIAAPVALVTDRSVSAMQVLTAVLGLVGLLSVVSFGRRVTRPGPAVFVAAVIAMGPLWGPLAASFMTDVPAFALGMLALAVGVEGVRRAPMSMPFVVGSVAVGLVAFAVREYAVVPALAVAITALWVGVARRDWRRVRIVVMALVLLAIAAALLLVWWHTVPDSRGAKPAMPDARSVKSVVYKGAELLRLVGFLVAPVLVLAGPADVVRRAWRASPSLTMVLGGGSALWLAGVELIQPRAAFVGNYFAPDGVFAQSVLVGHRPDILPAAGFRLLVAVGSLAGVLLAIAAVALAVEVCDRVRDRCFAPRSEREVILAAIGIALMGYGLAYAAAVLAGLPFWDRYALPLVPLASLLVLRGGVAKVLAGPRLIGTGIALVLVATVGLVYTIDAARFDGARWHVATLATRQGFPAKRVEGGFEWTSYRLGRPPGQIWGKNPQLAGLGKGATGRPHFCVKVQVNPRHRTGRVLASTTYRTLAGRTVRIVAMRTRQPCPDGPPGG